MNDNSKPQDDAANEDVKAELKGVPEEFLTDDDELEPPEADSNITEALEALKRDLEEAKQEVLYAKADTQYSERVGQSFTRGAGDPRQPARG